MLTLFFLYNSARNSLFEYSWLLIFKFLISQIVPNCDLLNYYTLVFTSPLWLVLDSTSKVLFLYAKCHVEQIVPLTTQVSGRTNRRCIFP